MIHTQTVKYQINWGFFFSRGLLCRELPLAFVNGDRCISRSYSLRAFNKDGKIDIGVNKEWWNKTKTSRNTVFFGFNIVQSAFINPYMLHSMFAVAVRVSGKRINVAHRGYCTAQSTQSIRETRRALFFAFFFVRFLHQVQCAARMRRICSGRICLRLSVQYIHYVVHSLTGSTPPRPLPLLPFSLPYEVWTNDGIAIRLHETWRRLLSCASSVYIRHVLN